jgi:hypothetical protein
MFAFLCLLLPFPEPPPPSCPWKVEVAEVFIDKSLVKLNFYYKNELCIKGIIVNSFAASRFQSAIVKMNDGFYDKEGIRRLILIEEQENLHHEVKTLIASLAWFAVFRPEECRYFTSKPASDHDPLFEFIGIEAMKIAYESFNWKPFPPKNRH